MTSALFSCSADAGAMLIEKQFMTAAAAADDGNDSKKRGGGSQSKMLSICCINSVLKVSDAFGLLGQRVQLFRIDET